jgi:hypothetical protein
MAHDRLAVRAGTHCSKLMKLHNGLSGKRDTPGKSNFAIVLRFGVC